jgi:hypothetical protein
MRKFWFVLNLILLVLVAVGAGAFYWALKEFAPNAVPAASTKAEAAPQSGPINLPDAIRFRIKANSVLQGEALLVEGGGPFRFTLRPVIDLPASTPTGIQAYVETHPNLEDRIEIEWKSQGGGTVSSPGEGRYEFNPPETGGDVRLAFRAKLKLTSAGSPPATLEGQTDLQMICPIAWAKLPQATQDLIGEYHVPGPKSTLAPYRNFYKRPTHFYRVTAENENLKVSPHFKLGDFDLHFDYTTPSSPAINQFPQYIALNPNLVLKLEEILSGLQEHGIQIDYLGILAGFRSPAYNAWKKKQGGVGGKYTKGFSTHMYGCAADFFVDRDGDGVMDDLNGDGKIDQDDAAWVRDQVVDAIDCQTQEKNPGVVGACGIYPGHDVPDRDPQTPNLHVDVRGFGTPRWSINSHDVMVTDYAHWQKNPCAGGAAKASPEGAEGENGQGE